MSNVLRKMRRHGQSRHLYRKPKFIKLNYRQQLQLEMMNSALGMVLLKGFLKAGKTATEIKHMILGDK